ncbi:hypothetical protein Hanom_Chr14g01270651 [Helianthus anomalus]
MSKSRSRPDTKNPDSEFRQNWVPILKYVGTVRYRYSIGTVAVFEGKSRYFTGIVPIPKMPKNGYRFRYRKISVRYFRDRDGS